jgi:hypothetical protein
VVEALDPVFGYGDAAVAARQPNGAQAS